MAGRNTTEPPDFSQKTYRDPVLSNKRKFSNIYVPSTSEMFPDVPWYNLDYQSVTSQVNEMLDEVILGLDKYIANDPDIKALVGAAKKAKKLPDLEKCHVAVLGQQAAGKSTLLAAVLGRALLERSGAHILEHIQRWGDVHPGSQDDGEDEEEDVDEEFANDFEDSGSLSGEATITSPKLRKSRETRRGASTAKEFFEVIFNVEEDVASKQMLKERLYCTDIREGDFKDLCIEKLSARFQQLDPQLRIKSDVSEFRDVHDKDLGTMRKLAKKLWPFVKVFTIETGHILLRYGMCLYDLPGWNDTNQLRAANINKFRWKADLELIVAEASRIQSDQDLERKIAQSIHIKKGSDRTILIMNKTDELLDPGNFGDQIYQIEEAPFPDLHARLNRVQSQTEDTRSQIEVLADYNDLDEIAVLHEQFDDIMREATVAYVKRETRLVQEHMQDKGIKMFSTSATSYLAWKDPMRRCDPLLSPESCGLPALMRFFLGIPANTNLKNYHDHVTKVLPALRKRAKRVLEKHTEDEDYANMRKDLAHQITTVRGTLDEIVARQLQAVITTPWSDKEELTIVNGIKDLFEKTWKYPNIEWHSWAKMMRENGIPVSGVFEGINLNEQVSGKTSSAVNNWAHRMENLADEIAEPVNLPIQTILAAVQLGVRACTAVPQLMEATIEALEDVFVDIEATYDTLLEDLQASLEENALRFTTEMDVECPIAQAMRPSYKLALDPTFVQYGRGIYRRSTKTLHDSILNPKRHYVRLRRDERIQPLVNSLKVQMVDCQRKLWKNDCDKFIEQVLEHLNDFLQTTEDLLLDAEYMTPEHQEARAKLERLLVHFDESLVAVQDDFKDLAEQPPAKRVKVEDSQDPGPSAATSGSKTCGEGETVPIAQNLGWHHFLATMHPLMPE